MKNKKSLIITTSCIASGIILIPLVSCTCVLALRQNEKPVLDENYLIVEDGVLKGIDWSKISIERIRIDEFSKLVIPEGVTEIAPYAFAYMFDGLATYVNEIDFSRVTETLTKIGDGAFNYCYGIESDLDFSQFSNLTYIGSEAFFYCTKIKSLKLPNAIIQIGDYAFFQNEGITQLEFSPKWKIGSHAFDACSKLAKLDFTKCGPIPTWLWEGSWIFNQTGLEAANPKVLVSLDDNDIDEWENALNTRQQLPSIWKIEAINNQSTLKEDFLYDEEDDTVIIGLTNEAKAKLNDLKSISIPEGTKKIAEHAFEGVFSTANTKVFKNLNLNKELTEIGDSAFKSCEMLSGSLKLPTGLKKLGKETFKNCFNLIGDVKIPEGVTELNDEVFAYTGIHSIKFHKKIEKVGKQLFYGCPRLSVIDLTCYGYGEAPSWDKPEQEQDKAFYSPSWSNGVVLVHEYATPHFIIDQAVTLLRDHGMIGHIDDSTETWNSNHWHCFVSDDRFNSSLPQDSINKAFVLDQQKEVKGLSQAFKNDKYCDYGIVAIPDESIFIGVAAFKNQFKKENVNWTIKLNTGLTTIGQEAFCDCSNLVGSLAIPSSVKEIHEKAFYNCNLLSGSLILPKNVESISASAFESTNFNSILLPSSKVCKTIGANAFEVTVSTKNIDFTRFDDTPTSWNASFIKYGTGSSGTIWVSTSAQKEMVNAFLSNTDWQSVKNNWPIKVIGEGA